MFRAEERHKGLTRAFASLWRNWAAGVGMLTLVTVLSPLVPRHTLPLFTLFIALGLRLYERKSRKSEVPTCFRFTRQIWWILLISAGAMALLNVYYMNATTEFSGQPINYELPFLSILVIAPIAALVNCVAMFVRMPSACHDCMMQWDDADVSFVGRLYRREWLYQTRLGLLLAIGSLVTDWAYYFSFFKTVNFNKPDYFFYIWLPAGIYVASLIYLGMRYYFLWVYFCHNDEEGIVKSPSRTELRFLALSDDKILLRKDNKTGLYDTPFVANVGYSEKPNMIEAHNTFQSLAKAPGFDLKFIYCTPDVVTFRNTFHFFSFLPNELGESGTSPVNTPEGFTDEWLPGMAVRQLYNHNRLATPIRREIQRIYRVAMAWKTYDRKGRRLYPIKNYKPTFRFADIRNWEIDYSDKCWLDVDRLNADKPFFKIRRLWRRFTHGLANVTEP